jgi:hypothetical protein
MEKEAYNLGLVVGFQYCESKVYVDSLQNVAIQPQGYCCNTVSVVVSMLLARVWVTVVTLG